MAIQVATRRKNGRWDVAGRVLAAIFLGFILTNTLGVFLSFALPISKDEAVATASVSSFLIYTVIILWVFSVKSQRRLWLGLFAATALTGIGSWGSYMMSINV